MNDHHHYYHSLTLYNRLIYIKKSFFTINWKLNIVNQIMKYYVNNVKCKI